MKKRELEKIWKQLDGATEALEKLDYAGIEYDVHLDFSAVVNLKNEIEEMIRKRTRNEKNLIKDLQ